MLRRCKLILGLVLISLLMCVVPTQAAPTVILDGQQLSFEVLPVIENDRTLVPLRAIFESLGATVLWDDATQTVTATKAGIEIKLTLGQGTAYKNGSPVPLSVPAKIINNRTMVPLRFVSEALGAQINWDDTTQTITISSDPTSGYEVIIKSQPEETVKTFYQAYFNRDFNTLAKNLSVFWSVRFLPEYADMSSAELLQNRAKIEGEIAKVIGDIEKENKIPSGISIKVMEPYTKEGKITAIVVYVFIENGREAGMETALLIKEHDQLRIFNMSPVDESTLEEIKNVDMSILDQKFEDLLTATNTK